MKSVYDSDRQPEDYGWKGVHYEIESSTISSFRAKLKRHGLCEAMVVGYLMGAYADGRLSIDADGELLVKGKIL